MVALPVIPISADSGLNGRAVKTSIGICRSLWARACFCCWSSPPLRCLCAMPGRLRPSRSAFLRLLAVYLAGRHWPGARSSLPAALAPWLVYLIPVWGVIQLVAHTTASSVETRAAVLRWGALAGVFFLAQTVARHADRAAQLSERVSDFCNGDGGALPGATFHLARARCSGSFRPDVSGRLRDLPVLQQLRAICGAGSADRPVASAARGLAILVVCAGRRLPVSDR